MAQSQPKNIIVRRNNCFEQALYLRHRSADVRFSFEDTTRLIWAHKNILTAKSDDFKSMFYGQLRETGNVKICDSSIAVFKKFIQFFYLDVFRFERDNVMDMLYLGAKYQVKYNDA